MPSDTTIELAARDTRGNTTISYKETEYTSGQPTQWRGNYIQTRSTARRAFKLKMGCGSSIENECGVCFSEGDVLPCCSHSHFVCNSCLEEWKKLSNPRHPCELCDRNLCKLYFFLTVAVLYDLVLLLPYEFWIGVKPRGNFCIHLIIHLIYIFLDRALYIALEICKPRSFVSFFILSLKMILLVIEYFVYLDFSIVFHICSFSAECLLNGLLFVLCCVWYYRRLPPEFHYSTSYGP